MNKKKWLIFVPILVVAAAAAFYFIRPKTKEEYTLFSVRQGSVKPVIITSSNIDSDDIFLLSFEVQGEVVTVTVSPGEEVSEGELLAQVSSDQLSSSLESSKLNLQGARLRYEQTKQIDESEIARLELQVESAKKNLDLASEALSDAEEELNSAELLLETTSSAEAQAQYKSAKEKYRAALTQYYSAESAYEQALLSLESSKQRKSVDLSLQSNQISLARVNLDASQKSVQELEMLSPVDGIILKVNIKPGDRVPSSQLTQNVTADIVVARKNWLPTAVFYLDQAELIQVKEGMDVIASLDVHPDTTFTGKIVSIDRYPEGGLSEAITYRAKAAFNSRPSVVLPGMSVTISILLPEEKGLIIPVTAVRYLDGIPHVFLSENGQLKRLRISTGASDNDYVIVNAGLKEGDQIVANIGELSEEILQQR